MDSVLLSVEVLSVLIDSRDTEDATKSVDGTTGADLITGQVVIANKVLSGLVHSVVVRQFLSSQQEREGVTTVVRVVNLSNFNGVVSKVVVHNERQVFALCVEAEDLTIVVQELLLGSNLTTTEGLLKELHHFAIAVGGNLLLGLNESISWEGLRRGLGGTEVGEESSSVFVAVVNSNLASVNANIATDAEVLRHEGGLRTVLLEDHLTVEESTLESSTVGLTGLSDHDGFVFQEVEDNESANSMVFKTAFNNTLLEVTKKSEDLLVKFHESRLELLLDVVAGVVLEN